MKIAYISSGFEVPVWGNQSASIRLRESAAALASAGHAVWVLSPTIATAKDEDKNEKSISNGKMGLMHSPTYHQSAGDLADVMFVPIPPLPRHQQFMKEFETLDKFWSIKTPLLPALDNLLYNLALYEKALNYLRSRQIDFVYERYAFFSHGGLRLARALHVPHLLEVSAPSTEEHEKIYKSEMKALAGDMERRLWVETDQIFAVSKQMQTTVVAAGALPSHIEVLPDAVALLRFDPVHEDRGLAVRKKFQLINKCVIGFAGILKARHGIEILIAAFRRLQTMFPDSHLLIIGDGPGREELQNYSRAHGLNGAVTFTGEVAYDELPPCLDALDIAVAPCLPGKKFHELCVHILEYMAMGKPVVAANIEEVQEIIADGETGMLYEAGNVAQLVAAFKKLAENEEFSCQLGDKARAWVQKARIWENNAQQVVRMASRLIQKRRPEELCTRISMS